MAEIERSNDWDDHVMTFRILCELHNAPVLAKVDDIGMQLYSQTPGGDGSFVLYTNHWNKLTCHKSGNNYCRNTWKILVDTEAK